mmetsp:Transcript_25268/g.71256  ORF Transcript_25268/g.71256 Transcript_25268/m.71256 type:complete len:611 (+) Transcript_25268:84-1916(+)
MGVADKLNSAVGSSKIGKYFKMEERGTTFTTEIIAGLTTFITLSYILAVNPAIIADSGGTCHPCDNDNKPDGCFPNQITPFFLPAILTDDYVACTQEVRRDLVIVTAAMSALATFLMGVTANLPFALAPGMGLNAYFTYTVVGFRGSGPVSFETALGAVFIEGIIFILFAAVGLRAFFVQAIPKPIKIATTGGIGLFLATLGLQTAEGIGLVVSDGATGVTMGACPPERRVPMYSCPMTKDIPGIPDGLEIAGPATIGAWTPEYTQAWKDFLENPGANPYESCLKGTANVYTCDEVVDAVSGKRLGGLEPTWHAPVPQSATTWLGFVGLWVCGLMYTRKWKGAIIVTVLFCSIISWINTDDNKVNYWKQGGDYEYFKKVVEGRGASSVAGKLSFSDMGDTAFAILMFFFVDFFDTSGTLYAMATYANLLDENGNFEGQYAAFLVDGVATTVGALCGTSPVTTYIESAPGILEGGRTGVTAIVVSLCFLVSLFFAPILASIPPWCTGFALIAVGAMMFKGVAKIDWEEPCDAIPAFVLLITMPLTYNIGYGLLYGWVSWAVINGLSFIISFIKDPAEAKGRAKNELSAYVSNSKKGLPCFMMKDKDDNNTI